VKSASADSAPGSNAAHKNHLHFDLGQHGKSGKYRICE